MAGNMWDFPWLVRAEPLKRGAARNVLQLAATLALTALVGVLLQLVELGSLDAAGRQFAHTAWANKVGGSASWPGCQCAQTHLPPLESL